MNEQGLTIIRCPTCRGSGKRLHSTAWSTLRRKSSYKLKECDHCNGSGYLERDWISAVYEKPIGEYLVDGRGHTFKANWNVDGWPTVQNEIIDKMANELVSSIDSEILRMFRGESK